MTECSCGSDNSFETCCGPYLSGEKEAPTAEALMRARYTAYATGAIEYLKKSLHPSEKDRFKPDDALKWSEGSTWKGLEIVEVEAGGEKDDKGIVEFVATYEQDDEELAHHEVAEFVREKGRWYFMDGKLVNHAPFVREAPKVGRNDPCHCGSGKKFKKCCAK
jgi:SEC-C motif-containing protein